MTTARRPTARKYTRTPLVGVGPGPVKAHLAKLTFLDEPPLLELCIWADAKAVRGDPLVLLPGRLADALDLLWATLRTWAPPAPTEPEQAAEALWRRALDRAKGTMTSGRYVTFFGGTRALALADGVILIGAPTPFAAEYLTARGKAEVVPIVGEIAERPVDVVFKVLPGQIGDSRRLEYLIAQRSGLALGAVTVVDASSSDVGARREFALCLEDADQVPRWRAAETLRCGQNDMRHVLRSLAREARRHAPSAATTPVGATGQSPLPIDVPPERRASPGLCPNCGSYRARVTRSIKAKQWVLRCPECRQDTPVHETVQGAQPTTA